MNENNYNIFFSNDLSLLGKRLRLEIHSSSILRKKYILLPRKHSPWKDWLTSLWLDTAHVPVVAGLEWMGLEEFFRTLFPSSGEKKPEITEDAIYFLLQEVFGGLPKTAETKPLRDYLKGASSKKSHDLRKTIAKLFVRYGIYGGKKEETWQKDSFWQGVLWKEIFETRGFMCPFLTAKEEQKRKEMPSFTSSLDIHLFGFSLLPKLYLDRLHRLSKEAKIFQYQISASPIYSKGLFFHHFLSDTKEKRKNLPQKRHQLLLSYGILEEKFLSFLDLENCALQERHQEKFPRSVLGNIQASFLYGERQKETLTKDDSLCILGAFGSKLREVEALLDHLFSFKKEDPSFSFSDIVIFAPDIASYEPYIELVFSSSGISYHVQEKYAASQSTFFHAFLSYVALLLSPFRKEDVFRLFSLLPVQKRYKSSCDEVEKLRNIFAKTALVFGIDEKHADLHHSGKNRKCFAKNHWHHAIKRVFFSLMIEQENSSSSFPPTIRDLSWEQRDLFSPFFLFFSEIKNDYKMIKEQGKKSALFWSGFLAEKLRQHFSSSEEDLPRKQEAEDLLKEMGKAPTTALFSLEDIYLFLQDRLAKKVIAVPKSKGPVVFFQSLQEASVTPVKLIYMLGMSEDSFPKKERKHPLDQLESYAPKSADRDRSIFLHVLLSAKEKLYISYQKRSLTDGKENALSSVIEELFSWIEERYGIKKHLWEKNIPINAAHPSLFTGDGPYRSYAKDLFCTLSLEKKKKDSASFFTSPEKRECVFPGEISVRDLLSFAKHPLKRFVNKTLSIYLPEEPSEETGFLLSPLEKYLCRKDLLEKSPEKLRLEKEEGGAFPLGIFADAASYELALEKEAINRHLEDSGLSPPTFSQETICLHLEVDHKPVMIQGLLENVFPEGLWVLQEKTASSILHLWPQILLYLVSQKKKECTVVFLRGEKTKKEVFSVEDPQRWLQNYLLYYGICTSAPSPFIPFWAKELLIKEENVFCKKAVRWKEAKDTYLHWALFEAKEISFSSIYAAWRPFLRSTFSFLVEEKWL